MALLQTQHQKDQKYEKLNQKSQHLVENVNFEEVVPYLKAIAKLNAC